MEEVNTNILLFGKTIYEPVTAITNVVITLLCLIFFFRIKTNAAKRFLFSWRLFFLFMGISATLGGVAHVVHQQLGKLFFDVFWMSMNLCSLASAFFCFRATVLFSIKKQLQINRLNIILYSWMSIAVILTLLLNNFLIVKINSGIFILYTLVMHIITAGKGSPGSKWIVAGFGISLLSILVHSFKISFHEFFNFKDISHVVMWVSLYLLYRGVKQKEQSAFTAAV